MMIQKMKKYYLYRKLIILFLVFIIISVGLIGSFLYLSFQRTAEKERYDFVVSNLYKSGYSFGQVYDRVNPLVNYILLSGYFTSILEGDSVDRLMEFQVQQKLKLLQITNSQFANIGLVNLKTNRYIGTQGGYFDIEEKLTNISPEDINRGLYCIPRKIHASLNNDESPEIEVLTFIYYPKGMYSEGFFVFDIEISNFQEIFLDSASSEEALSQEKRFVLDYKGRILISSCETPEVYLPFMQEDKILNSNTSSGSLERVIDGQKQIIAYVKNDSSDYYYVSIYPKEIPVLKERLQEIILVVLALVIIYAIILVSMFRNIYRPINVLVNRISGRGGMNRQAGINEMEALRSAFEDYEQTMLNWESDRNRFENLLKINWLKSVLNGNIKYDEEEQKLPDYCDYHFEAAYLNVLVLSIDYYKEFLQKIENQDSNLYEFIISNMVNELIGGSCVNKLILVEENRRAVVIRTGTASLPSEVIWGLKELQRYLSQYLNITITASYGSFVTQWQELYDSYRSAEGGLRKKLYLGVSEIIDSEYTYGKIQNAQYPYKTAVLIEEAVLTEKQIDLEKAVNHFIGKLKNLDSPDILSFVSKCCQDLIHKVCVNDWESETKLLQEAEYEVAVAETLQDIEKTLHQLCSSLLAEKKERSREKNPAQEIIGKAMQYIEEHYANDVLSVEMMAEIMNLTAAYFGKLFYQTMQKSCNDYIGEIRMQKAAKLLIETNETIGNISEKVGIVNTNYFYVLFKKNYGMTPAQYRKEHSST